MTDRQGRAVSDSLRIPSAEFEDRRQRARSLAEQQGLAGLVVWSRNATTADWYGDVMYLTNHHNPFPQLADNPPAWSGRAHSVLVLPVDGQATLITDTVEHRPDLLEIDDVRLGFNVPALVAKVLGEKHLTGERLGLVGRESLLWSSHQLLTDALGRTPQLEPADEIVLGLRRRKSAAELQLMRNAARVGCDCVTAMMQAVEAGRTEGDVVGEGLRVAASGGFVPYDIAVASGPHAECFQWARLPSWDSERPLENGDLIHIDCWGPVLGYYTDLVRSSVVGGTAQPGQAELLDGAVAFVEHVIEAIRPGITFGALWERGAAWLTANGFDEPEEAVGTEGATLAGMFPGFGHGIGLGTEDPYIMPGVETVIEEDMVIAVEILLSRRGIGGAGFEQDVIVTASGGDVITAACPARWWS
jgi:Xaa-Pro aminopeptidase